MCEIPTGMTGNSPFLPCPSRIFLSISSDYSDRQTTLINNSRRETESVRVLRLTSRYEMSILKKNHTKLCKISDLLVTEKELHDKHEAKNLETHISELYS